jgi:hypothetical protein
MATTENFVGDFIALSNVAHDNLFALSHHDSIYSSRIMSGARSTPTESFHLQGIHAICEFN